MSTSFNVHPHPEWRRLLEALTPELEIGQRRLFGYEELNTLAGIDVRSSKGRRQFLRFAREALLKYSTHFENVRNQGYRTVEPNEHGGCAVGRVKRARRQMRNAGRIAKNVQWEKLNANMITMHTDLIARIAMLTKTIGDTLRPLHKIAQSIQTGVLPHPLRVNGPAPSPNNMP